VGSHSTKNPARKSGPADERGFGQPETLKWKAEGADTFHVQVATDPRFKWLVIDDHYVKANSFDLKALTKGQQYFWRIAARKPDNDAGNTKGFFKTSSFEVTE
jgi:hypothetical protein